MACAFNTTHYLYVWLASSRNLWNYLILASNVLLEQSPTRARAGYAQHTPGQLQRKGLQQSTLHRDTHKDISEETQHPLICKRNIRSFSGTLIPVASQPPTNAHLPMAPAFELSSIYSTGWDIFKIYNLATSVEHEDAFHPSRVRNHKSGKLRRGRRGRASIVPKSQRNPTITNPRGIIPSHATPRHATWKQARSNNKNTGHESW